MYFIFVLDRDSVSVFIVLAHVIHVNRSMTHYQLAIISPYMQLDTSIPKTLVETFLLASMHSFMDNSSHIVAS